MFSEAGAIVVSAAFLILSLACFDEYRTTSFRLYLTGGGLAGAVRGIAYAIHAATIARGSTTRGDATIFLFFTGAGLGIATAVQLFVIGGWLKNTAPHLKMAYWRGLHILTHVLFPLVLLFGPIFSLATALLMYVSDLPSATTTARRLYEATGVVICVLCSVSLLMVLDCCITTLKRVGWSSNLWKHANSMILCLLPGALLLAWAAAFRVAAIYGYYELTPSDRVYYPLQVLPEILQLATWAIPTLYARIHLSTRFEEWWKQMHPDGPEPTFGFPARTCPSSQVANGAHKTPNGHGGADAHAQRTAGQHDQTDMDILATAA